MDGEEGEGEEREGSPNSSRITAFVAVGGWAVAKVRADMVGTASFTLAICQSRSVSLKRSHSEAPTVTAWEEEARRNVRMMEEEKGQRRGLEQSELGISPAQKHLLPPRSARGIPRNLLAVTVLGFRRAPGGRARQRGMAFALLTQTIYLLI